jgi:hypothetical protein
MPVRRPIEGLLQGVSIRGIPRHAQFARQAGGAIVGDPVIGSNSGLKGWYWTKPCSSPARVVAEPAPVDWKQALCVGSARM